MFCRMTPYIEVSISQLEDDKWTFGSHMVCEVRSEPHETSVASWKGQDGCVFSLRPISVIEKSQSRLNEGVEDHRVHSAGTSSAVWRFGEAFVKVKSWKSGMQLEERTIKHVSELVGPVAVPEVIFSWIDEDWNRTFLLLKAMNGKLLDHMWDDLSDKQHEQLGEDVAGMCASLASNTSKRLETVDGKGALDGFLTAKAPDSEPSWRPRLLGPFAAKELQGYAVADDDQDFYLYHADLGPTNIMLDDDGRLTGVIDWESTAYFPKFWLGTKPLQSAGFYLENKDGKSREQRKAWAYCLTEALERRGFASGPITFKAWREAILETSRIQ